MMDILRSSHVRAEEGRRLDRFVTGVSANDPARAVWAVVFAMEHPEAFVDALFAIDPTVEDSIRAVLAGMENPEAFMEALQRKISNAEQSLEGLRRLAAELEVDW